MSHKLMPTSRSRPLVAWIAAMLSAGCTASAPHAETLFREYMVAVNAHDLATIEAMTAAAAVWGSREGRAALMDQTRFDVAMGIELTVSGVVSRGDTVEATLVERTASHRAHGPDSTLHYVRFVFRNDQVIYKGRTRPDPLTPEEFARHAQPFRAWIQRTYPEARAQLLNAAGVLRVNEETGRLMARLLAEWVEAGRP